MQQVRIGIKQAWAANAGLQSKTLVGIAFNIALMLFCCATSSMVLSAQTKREKLPKVVVLEPTDNRQAQVDQGDRTVPEILRKYARIYAEDFINNTKRYSVADDAKADRAIIELDFPRAGSIIPKKAAALGSKLGADLILDMDMYGETWREKGKEKKSIDAVFWLIDVKTGDYITEDKTTYRDDPASIRITIESLLSTAFER